MHVAQRNFTMIEFPGRALTIGSADLTGSEQPPHEVELDAFALGDTCVTAADFHAFLRDAPAGVGHQMLGNLREWCQDRYGAYSPGRQHNPGGAARGVFRVVRGGSFIDPAGSLGPASRLAAHEETRCEVYGFRVARRPR